MSNLDILHRASVPLLLALFLLSSSGCASPAPRRGFIAFYNPGGRTGRGLQASAATLVYYSLESTDAEEELVEDSHGIQVEVGQVAPRWTARLPADDTPRVARRAFNLLNPVPTELAEDEFAELWRMLEKAGIFDLPPYEGSRPPEGKAFFLLDDTENQTIFVRPETDALSSVQTLEHLTIWGRASQVILTGTYSERLHRAIDRRELRSTP
ncbi:MAG: hypothetical protein JXA90_03415 [Planctomycetes bacterium]|nr:hypothetical protein [Planctomycetota bacterium]